MRVEESSSTRAHPGAKPILVLRKARLVLDCFSAERPALTFQQLREASGLPSSTCLRLLHSLADEGFLDRDGARYRPGRNLLYWASLAASGLDIATTARPFLVRLRDETGETACLYARDGFNRSCIAIEQTRHSIVRRVHIGEVMPLTAGSAGKVFLAFEDELRHRMLSEPLTTYTDHTITDPERLASELRGVASKGYAVSRGERDEGAGSVSAPVYDASGQVVAAIGLAGPLQRFSRSNLRSWAPLVVVAGQELSALLGHRLRGMGA